MHWSICIDSISMDVWLVYYSMPCLFIIDLSNMNTFTKTASSSLGVANVVKVTSLISLVMISLWYRRPFPFSAVFCKLILDTSTTCANYQCQSIYNQHRSRSIQTRRNSWAGSPHLSKNTWGKARLGLKKMSRRRRPECAFLWPDLFL